MNSNLDFLINTFFSSKERDLQLDFFRSNGQVLLQVYKQYDVNKWDLEFNSTDKNATVLEICFHRDKTDNKENFDRFCKSDYCKDFLELEKNSYFYRIESTTSSEKVKDFLLKLIFSIYKLEDKKIEFTLNAY